MAPQVKHLLVVGVLLLASCLVIYSSYDPPLSAPFYRPTTTSGDISIHKVLQYIYNPTGFSLATPSFTHESKVYELPANLQYTEPLGKDVCILDVDTRPFEDANQVFHAGDFEFEKLEPHSGGVLNHYTYAQTHGYDYRFVRVPPIPGRHATWVKVPGLLSVLSSYKFVVFMDADALFNQMHIPVEWLLNYWSIDSTISLAMALDPEGPQNNDTNGRRYANTGFIIAQNNPKTYEILTALDECPEETRYEGCAVWADTRFDEQAAFGRYVRYDYDEYIKELPCEEANGEWDLEICKGVFIQHMWWRTDTVSKRFGEQTLQSLMERVHENVMDDKRRIVKET